MKSTHSLKYYMKIPARVKEEKKVLKIIHQFFESRLKNSDLGKSILPKKGEHTRTWMQKLSRSSLLFENHSTRYIARRSTEMLATFREMGSIHGSPVDEPLLSRRKSRRNERDKDFSIDRIRTDPLLER